ncbi:MAG TPA: hypothetical protein VFB62_26755 [Polyangiaceae bacterium]|nr:hypothetical protein [Polyangiaceae bacterium]
MASKKKSAKRTTDGAITKKLTKRGGGWVFQIRWTWLDGCGVEHHHERVEVLHEAKTKREAEVLSRYIERKGPSPQPAPASAAMTLARRLAFASREKEDRHEREARVAYVLALALNGNDDALKRLYAAASPMLLGAPAWITNTESDRMLQLQRDVELVQELASGKRMINENGVDRAATRDDLLLRLADAVCELTGQSQSFRALREKIDVALRGKPKAWDLELGSILKMAGMDRSEIKRRKDLLRKLRASR